MTGRRLGRRSLLLGGAGAALGAGALAGCARGPGGKPEGSFKQPGVAVPAKYAGRKTVVAWHSFGGHNGKAMNQLTDKFNSSQKDIYLSMQYQGGYDTTLEKFTAGTQSGTSPDMVTVSEGSQGKLELQHMAEDMSKWFTPQELSRFTEVMLDQWRVGDAITQIPFARSTPLWYYNKDLYAKIGLPDRAPTTWSEYTEWGAEFAKLKDPHGDPMLGVVLGTSAWEYQSYVWVFGGNLSKGLDITVNQGGAAECARYFRDLCKKKNYAAVAPQDTFNNAFAGAGLYSTASIANVTKTVKFRLGTGFLPGEKLRAVPTGGSGFTVPKGIHRSNKEAAVEVLKWLAEPDNAAFWTINTGYMPIVTDAKDSEVFKKKAKEDPNYLTPIEQLTYAKATDAMRSFVPGSGNINAQFISLIFQSTKPLQGVLDQWQSTMQRAADNVKPAYKQLFGDVDKNPD